MDVVLVGQVGVQVDEPGQQGGRAEVENARSRRDGEPLSHFDDAVAFDSHHRGDQGPAPAPVDQTPRLQHERFGAGGGNGAREKEREQLRAHPLHLTSRDANPERRAAIPRRAGGRTMTMRVSLGLGGDAPGWARCALAQDHEIAFREASISMPDGVKLAADLYLPASDRPQAAWLATAIGVEVAIDGADSLELAGQVGGPERPAAPAGAQAPEEAAPRQTVASARAGFA